MSEVFELDVVLSAAMLRTAIRAKLRAGTDRQVISWLIRKYVSTDVSTTRLSDGVYRLPVELIPLDRRTAFLDALNELCGHEPGVTLNLGCV